ncbi:Hypothetical predicted protein [Paramuricea clavata]|uniref:Uncharacterized protein n=1 Tax=Paramuricea clavata TaxID=317549 RepID=A0A6S7K572_PARCT|nr:Hypothetical predicted protein [Paramuricea clavata]
MDEIERDDTSFDILEEEGQPGWYEKILALGEKMQKEGKGDEQGFGRCGNFSKRTEINSGWEKRAKFPSLAQTKLSDAFNKIGPEADGAKTGLAKISEKWNEIPADNRGAIVKAVQTSATLFEKFAKADEDPVGAVRATIDIVAQFTALAGPKGQIISIALSFVSGFLALFGVGKSKKQQPDFSKIVRKEIDAALNKYYDKVLSDEIAGTLHNFVISKAYVDSLSKSGGKLTEHQATSLKVNVPLWNGLTLLGKLEHRIKALLKENKRETVEKLLKYIELYARLAILKDMILLQSIALLPDQRNRAALLSAQLALRRKQKSLLQFLFNAKVDSKLAVRYFDPDTYPVTDKYLIALLKVPDFDRSLSGKWCMTQKIRGWSSRDYRLGFFMRYRQLMKSGHPYVMSGGITCIWKVVPHGNNLYTIAVTSGCPKGPRCGHYMSHDLIGSNKMRVTVEPDADFWEITGDKLKQ